MSRYHNVKIQGHVPIIKFQLTFSIGMFSHEMIPLLYLFIYLIYLKIFCVYLWNGYLETWIGTFEMN